MRLLAEHCTSFALGVNDAAAAESYMPQEVARLVNGSVNRQGDTITRRRGFKSPQDASGRIEAANVPVQAAEFFTAAAVQQICAFHNGKLFTSLDEGVTWTDQGVAAADKLANKSIAIIREGTSNVLCVCDGNTSSYQWDGTTLSTIANIPASPKYLEVFGDRLIAAGHSGVTVAASKVGDIDVWASPDGWTIEAKTNDGDTEITGMFQLGSILLVFKRHSVGYIEGFGYQTLQVATGARGISRSVGCVAPRTIAAAGDNAVMWLSERGWEYYQLGGQITLVSGNMQSFVDSLMWDDIRDNPLHPNAAWWPSRQEYWCAVPLGLSGVASAPTTVPNSHIYVYRPATGQTPPAMWCHSFSGTSSLATITSMSVDTSGRLQIDDTMAGSQVTTQGGGGLGLSEGNEYGIDPTVFTSNGRLALESAEIDRIESLFTANRGSEINDMWFGGDNGRVYYMEGSDRGDENADSSPNSFEPIRMLVRLRPLLFGAQFLRKKVKRIRVQSAQSKTSTVAVMAYADGVAGASQTLTFSALNRSRPDEQSARVGGRGNITEVELRSEDDVTVTGVEVLAQVMGDQP